jgi:hypothetical protein
MSSRHTAVLSLSLSLTAALGCSDQEPTIAPTARCAELDLALVAQGTLEQLDGVLGEAKLEAKTTDSEILGLQAWLRLPGYNPGDGARTLVVRLYAGGAGNLLTRIERATASGPITLSVVDATEIPAGNVSATALDRYPCSLEEGTICVQVGEDSNNNGSLDDQDVRVFNAKGGSVTFQPLDFTTRRLTLTYDVQLGRNVIDVRSMTSGSLAGCLDAKYEVKGESGWSLR